MAVFYAVAVFIVAFFLWVFWQVGRLRSLDTSKVLAGSLRLRIEALTGVGTSNSFVVSGRVTKDGGRLSALNAEFDRIGIATKFRQNLRRFLLPEMAGVALTVNVAGVQRETTTQAYGQFDVFFRENPILPPGTTIYSVELHEGETRYEAEKVTGHIHILSPDTKIGVITDFDDTIVTSHIQNKLRMVLNVALTTELDLEPTPGLATLLRELSKGSPRNELNPIFYVSGSPMNLHDKIYGFLKRNGFPLGPIFLTAIGLDREAGFFAQKIFKKERIREILMTFPKLRFVLFGDNGQYDSEVYQQISQEFPGRLLSTLIYERVPRIKAHKILPIGQHRFSNAFDAALMVYQRKLISKDGLVSVVEDLKAADVLRQDFHLEGEMRKAEKRNEEANRKFGNFS